MSHAANRFLLVVFDGLRPDMMSPADTPNLLRFAALGTRFARGRSVFPSETRVCSSSVATGCLPRRHGLVANRIAHPLDPTRSIDTGDVAALKNLREELGAPVLEAPTMANLLAVTGRDVAVFSSGTTGQTWLLNPDADALGHITLSAHGPHACSAAGRALLATLDPPPRSSAARATWIAEAFRVTLLPDPPAASILWLCEPDSTGHYGGIGSSAQRDALRQVDAAFGRILDDWQAGPHRDTLHLAVASDHGQIAITGHRDLPAALAPFPDCHLLSGSSCGLMVPGGDADRIADVAGWLTRQDWCGAVFAADNADLPPGVLKRSTLLADHPRAAHVLFTLRTRFDNQPTGLSGSTLGDVLPGSTLGDGQLAIGAGTHGGLTAPELHIVLMLAGAAIRQSVSEWPAGLVDIAPTALSLLGAVGAVGMDGRILTEAFVDGAPPTDSPAPESWAASGPGYAQRLARTRLGRHIYVDEGFRQSISHPAMPSTRN